MQLKCHKLVIFAILIFPTIQYSEMISQNEDSRVITKKLATKDSLRQSFLTKRLQSVGPIGSHKFTEALKSSRKSLGLPNLLPFQPTGWSGPIVVSTIQDSNLDSTSLAPSTPLYVDFAIGNDGDSAAGPFVVDFYIDTDKISLPYDNTLDAGYGIGATDIPIGMLPAGVHTIKVVADATGLVPESDESDNEYTKTITITGSNIPNLTMFQPHGWSDSIVVSNVKGTHTDTSTLVSSDSLYADFCFINNGTAPTGPFKVRFFLDGSTLREWQINDPIDPKNYGYFDDFPLGTFSPGTHTLHLSIDPDNSLLESIESDNEYTKTVSVIYGTNKITSIFVPVVISTAGLNGAFFTSEMIMTNKGAQNASLDFSYNSSFGGGSGTGSDTLNAGQQRIVPDAISYLRSLGVPIPSSGNLGGTLTVSFSGLADASDAAITVRTTTAVEGGRAGLAYPGIPLSHALNETVYLCGLRQNDTDRSNVAIQNTGPSKDGDIVLKLTVFSGDPTAPFSKELPLETLPPGAFKQISGILQSNGMALTNGYVRVERQSGNASYYAYAVINDQANSDGSFVFPIRESDLQGSTRLTLPVVVEANTFSSEFIVTNWSQDKKTLHLELVADSLQTSDHRANFTLEIKPSEQVFIEDFVDFLRKSGTPGIGEKGPSYTGAIFVEVSEGDLTGIAVSARTSSPGGGGRFGLFYGGVPKGMAILESSWIYGLQQNTENRSNLAIINTGEFDSSIDTFKIEIFDGETGKLANTIDGINLNARGWKQFGAILSQFTPNTTQGFAKVTKVGGLNPFITYGVVNDGAQPGMRTGDGAFIPSSH